MDLVPCDETARQLLVGILYKVQNDGTVDKKAAQYVAKTFPNILLDVARLLTEQATSEAHQYSHDPATAIKHQLKPYFTFSFLLGKAPQISSLMYNYFESSSFQPLPESIFQPPFHSSSGVIYTYPGFNDDLVKDILIAYSKYLAFDAKWFSTVWNWSELGRLIYQHPSNDIKYLAACCLSMIMQPTRYQYLSFINDVIPDRQTLIDLQIKYRFIYDNTFQPVIETRAERADEFLNAVGKSTTGYTFCPETLTKITNILLLRRDPSSSIDDRVGDLQKKFVTVKALNETISKIAYAASINKPCLIRGPSGSGKTVILDFIAAHTNRLFPPNYIKVQIGEQIDSKLLIGSYVCTEIPGQFEWQPGPLAQAMSYGSWIVFEDIDSAPAEMAQVIHSVIENGNLSCVACSPIKMDSPHPDFRIFFTQRTRIKNNSESLKLGFGFVERLCDIVEIPELCDQDLIDIIKKRYSFDDLSEYILKIFRAASDLLSSENEFLRFTRPITLRDLFKLCDRISSKKIRAINDKYSSIDLDSILLDSIDCLASFLPKGYIERPVVEFAKILGKPTEYVESIMTQRRPEIRENNDTFMIGRVNLDVFNRSSESVLRRRDNMAHTRQTLQLLEKVTISVKYREPVLLVGETGVGKTSIVQHLAHLMRVDLVVVNLSQQSDSCDLLGGHHPVDMREIIQPIHERFDKLFPKTFDHRENEDFLTQVETKFTTCRTLAEWSTYLRVVRLICGKALQIDLPKAALEQWRDLMDKVRKLSKRIAEDETSPMALTFYEGTLIRAVRRGDWILLDEINLAESEVLQCLLLILDSIDKSHLIMHTGNENSKSIPIHPNFRVFACMNPSTDVGKRDLPVGIRNRFTEVFVDDLMDTQELRLIVESYVQSCLKPEQIERVVNFYREVRARSVILNDISGNAPIYSLRTLCRALMICSNNVCQNVEKSLYESLKVTFLQQLNEVSTFHVLSLIETIVFKGSNMKQIAGTPPPCPKDGHNYLQIEGFWIQTSSQKKVIDESYILTQSVRKNLERIARVISLGQRKLPILLQGNTSVGKTSLIKYLAKLTGNLCYRINNHEHTDLQDYVGRYVLNESGNLEFQEGLLVTAMKKGYWVILDELNLAPSELLEALNRVLDDNRELFISEIGQTVRAHSKFMLFATQNPPEEYVGRKLLSRAFRNRFVELHFDEIPHSELQEILQRRCKMPPKYATTIVNVMKELQMFRRESGCFSGKDSFMTMRDLFRWGERYLLYKDTVPEGEFRDWDQFLASEGLILLEGRARTVSEADTILQIIQKNFKRKLDRGSIYSYEKSLETDARFKHIHFTREFKRFYVQLSSALRYGEPVLLCGQTGCGKTTACQLYAALKSRDLVTYNCHYNTESSDFIGDVRPSRSSKSESKRQAFTWVDGPIVQAMRGGSIFLMDEISLADDAVLERINSVLEPERTITLIEKDGEEVIAKPEFRLVATMNPGGDFGKKELSPALRNRFTEIYCHNTSQISQIIAIIEKSLCPVLLKPQIVPKLVAIMKKFLTSYYKQQDIISLRDVLNWTKFLNQASIGSSISPLSIQDALIEGAALVFFDQFGTCGHRNANLGAGISLKEELTSQLDKLVQSKFGVTPVKPNTFSTPNKGHTFEYGKYRLRKRISTDAAQAESEPTKFIIETPTVRKNFLKLIRAMQLDRPILLEGDPGAGKTSIVENLARLTGYKLVRINLSEQTDIADLFGSDLPEQSQPANETEKAEEDRPRFCWQDGPMLKAIKESSWVLLDEMNLASQSVLEGLNACFDHRGEVYIPELNKKFDVDRSETRIFACQNPFSQGAARKGLPQSFLNRFTSIYIESHSSNDLLVILKSLYPELSDDMLEKMISFNQEVSARHQNIFEFNLRDLIYWSDLLTKYPRLYGDETSEKKLDQHLQDRFAQFVYLDRMRCTTDRTKVMDLFEEIFGYPIYEPPYRDIKLGEYSLTMGRTILPRNKRIEPNLSDLCILKYQMPYIESIAKAIEFKKMPILVGGPGVGKRSMVRILARLTGNNLHFIGANSEMDTIELLGSFEQKSLQREIVELVDEAGDFISNLINGLSQKPIANDLTKLYKYIWSTVFATSIRDLKLSKGEMMEAYRFQLSQMEDLLEKLGALDLNSPKEMKGDGAELNKLKVTIRKLKKRVLFHSESMYSSGNFEWVDSILIRSIRDGSWVVIENANLMNPATLDRLNSLVELNGSLALNEKGSGPSGTEILKPHPNFRLILTIDPDHGELSRAMRNRGVEIFVRPRFFFEDFLMLLNQNGFEPEEKKACMTYCIMETSYNTHLRITGEQPELDGELLAYFGLNYLTALAHQIRRGLFVDKVLADLLIAFYHNKGLMALDQAEEIIAFVAEQMNVKRKLYIVDLGDDRYKWCHFRHDLMSMSGGDAILAMLLRENRLFYDNSDPIETGTLKGNELIDNLDIVNTCTTVKIFLELATHGDFEYRKGFIKETFLNYPSMMDIVNNSVESLYSECMPLIKSLMPRSEIAPIDEMYVDTRNSLEMQYYLQAIDYEGTIEREDMQNRWLLSLHRITIQMIIDLVEERSNEVPENRSLWLLSEQVRKGEVLKEDLFRPQAEIATELFDLLQGILRVVSDRCFSDRIVVKMLARFFWIGYFICKLKKAMSRIELIAICNQLPMLWALTYQKVIVPTIEDCKLADLVYNKKKFSTRLEKICNFLNMTVVKPSKEEKSYHSKVINLYATVTKREERINREVDKFFATLIGRYTVRSQALSLGTGTTDTLAASGLVWSNSLYMSPLYLIQEHLLHIDSGKVTGPEAVSLYEESKQLLDGRKSDYRNHEIWLRVENYRSKCLNINRRRNALDQFAPIWQTQFIQERFSRLHPYMDSPAYYRKSLDNIVRAINGIILSPKYYSTLTKFLDTLESRDSIKSPTDDEVSYQEMKLKRHNADMYSTFLVGHFMENVVLDNQIVGWTKLRVTTSDLSSEAPLIPEYSPIISLVGSYCLDIAHLKLNSYKSSCAQLDAILVYLWRAYCQVKFNSTGDSCDLALADNLIHLQTSSPNLEDYLGTYKCELKSKCRCIDKYITHRASSGNNRLVEVLNDIGTYLDKEDEDVFRKSLKLLFFGYFFFLEHAPIFSLDPSLRSREKLEVYKSELAHVKLDLSQRNTLYYWKTGENLRLLDINPDEAKIYPFSIRVLVERRAKLESSIARLRREHTSRPKSDDGSMYYELKKEVEVSIARYSASISALVSDIQIFMKTKKFGSKSAKLNNLTTRCRMLIKSLERSICHLKSDYTLYSDLTTYYLAGLCFVLQGVRRLYSHLEQKLRLVNSGFSHASVRRFTTDVSSLFSFNNFSLGNMESVHNKQRLYTHLNIICPEDKISHMQSLLLRSILIQLNHHIIMTPSDIKSCIPIVRNIADRFHRAWLERKKFLEEQRRKQEEIYQYKTSRTTLGAEITFERQEFIDICTKFPTYDHVYHNPDSILPTSADKENLETEAKIINLNKSVDLGMCIDICKAHYNFMKEASLSLLGQRDLSGSKSDQTKTIDLSSLVKHEAEILYTIIRKSIPSLDRSFDSLNLECHLLQANELIKIMRQTRTDQLQLGSLKSSIDILDEDIFDIYYSANVYEALKFQKLIGKIDNKVNALRNLPNKGFDTNVLLLMILKLTSRISSFLITDPLMKFVTGAHSLLQSIDDWNRTVPMDIQMKTELDDLIELIKSWRQIEVQSWKSSLHRVKRKYIDGSLCDLWFRLYEAFNDPIKCTTQMLKDQGIVDEEFEFNSEDEESTSYLYQGFVMLIKEFFEDATLGDYQIRLDLVFSFAIQTRFAGLYEESMSLADKEVQIRESKMVVDYEKLTTYVFNIYKQYQGLMEPLKEILEREEQSLSRELNDELRIVAWQGRNLWDIKHNFRISHRKLNKVMNKYLDVLKRSPPSVRPSGNQSEKTEDLEARVGSTLPSRRLEDVFEETSGRVNKIEVMQHIHGDPPVPLESLVNVMSIVHAFKKLNSQIQARAQSRYIDIIRSCEKTYEENHDAIRNFHDHKVSELVLNPRDSKEQKAEKLKSCRQMYHSKKYSMQTIFKSLHQLGVSYQRGLNSQTYLDNNILALEPLRGMIQHQSRLVLNAASKLVDDSLIISCNDIYRDLITKNQLLLAQQANEALTSDQVQRIHGLSYDMVLDIIIHYRNVALIYRHLMDIQAAATRLQSLQDQDKAVVIYNFARVHHSVRLFNEFVSRSISAVSKLEMLMKCYEESRLESLDDKVDASPPADGEIATGERTILRDLIGEIDINNCLMTPDQYEHISNNLNETRQGLAQVSIELRDKLNNTIRNYFYSDDDIHQLRQLYSEYTRLLDNLVTFDEENRCNTRPGTILGSFRQLVNEANSRLKPLLEPREPQSVQPVRVDSHPNKDKLNVRLQKLLRQTKLAIQELYKNEEDFANSTPTSETARRKLKPFNHIDSSVIRTQLRTGQVAKQTSNCFMTLNLVGQKSDIKPIVDSLSPILSIYTQDVACYLNIILHMLHMKLLGASQLIPFFTDLVLNGFGLPCKLSDLDQSGAAQPSDQQGDDNTGFGEGEGVKDASKKLEFESQLDDLKKDESKEDGEQQPKDDDEPIEAHDDGIEMSDDIPDSKAHGPDQKELDGQEEEENKDEEQEEEDEAAHDELEKELDEVDEDEGQLDQNLWDDKDKDLGDDDEEDLRQADLEPGVKPEMGDKELKAKMEPLEQSSDQPTDGHQAQADSSEKIDVDVDGEEEEEADATAEAEDANENEDAPMEEDEESFHDANDGEAEFDLDAEAEQAKRDQDNADAPETEDISDLNLDELQDHEPVSDISEMDFADDSNLDDNGGGVDDSEKDKRNGQNKTDGQNDQENTDEKNEAETMRNPSSKPKEDQNEGEEEDEIEKAAQDDPESCEVGQGAEQKSSAKLGGQTGATDDAEPEKEDAERANKRTLAERSMIEQANIKRQRIEEAAANDDNNPLDETPEESSAVRHVASTPVAEIEVIDLASDSDDCLNNDDIDSMIDESHKRPTTTGKTGEEQEAEGAGRVSRDDNVALEQKQSSYNTNLGLLKYINSNTEQREQPDELMDKIEKELGKSSGADQEHGSLEADNLTSLWLESTKSVGHLVQELCQQLQIVLQPTKMSKYKGDYKSGKRLNMRKIISYIASHYRKDKIWLRRTKACKRTYNITLAVDNSSSMSENNCRQMTFQSLALLAKSLSLIEAGALNVVSFGERVKCIHEFGQIYADAVGAQWLRELRFNETRTSYKKVLEHACDSFRKQAQVSLSAPANVNQLLVLISDGRNVSSEEDDVRLLLRQLKSMGVLTLFVIIDDLKQNKGKSIMEVKSCVGSSLAGSSLRVENYMDRFPFPFYVLLRQIDSMPSILGDALRQWFELVSQQV